MRVNGDCTLYNRLCDPETREEYWRRTELRGVMWQEERRVNVTEQGLQSANDTAVYIPGSVENAARYARPDAFGKAHGDAWTLRDGDMLDIGIVSGEAPPDTARVITGTLFQDFGGAALRHWEVHLK